MFRWYFSHRFIDDFARVAVDELVRLVPAEAPKADKTKTRIRHEQRLAQGVGILRRRLAEFRAQHRLNLFQKARLSQRLQNEMLERGYAVELAREVALDAIPSG